MISKHWRIILLVVLGALAAYCIYTHNAEVALILALAFILLLYSHIAQGSVARATRAYQAGDFALAQKYLDETVDPDKLSQRRRGFYEFVAGNLALKKGDTELAERHFQIATRFPLRNKNDKALVLVNLANIALQKKDPERALAYIKIAEENAVTQRVKDIIKKIKETANNIDA